MRCHFPQHFIVKEKSCWTVGGRIYTYVTVMKNNTTTGIREETLLIFRHVPVLGSWSNTIRKISPQKRVLNPSQQLFSG